ncbi:gamma-aminobutyric acid receptor subunit beta-1-like, partial [Symsagittifera roscoffensis]|uniref:gamma-aminobutyric acid receptor subunit beta-1-like n=1 Tax=Symsagittifera roscoffensis TaxID=84072 RepID=UPI00307BAAFB
MSCLNLRLLILVYTSVRSLVLCDAVETVKARRNVIQRTPIPWNLTQMILEGYDPRLRPNFGNPNKPVEVKVDLVVGSVDEISEVNMDFTLTIYLRQYWKDHRLSFKHILGEDIKVMPVDGRITDKLWLPDTYFTNDKDSYLQDITVKNRMVRIMKDGTVVFGL